MLFEISKPKFSVIETVLRNFLEIFEILSGKMDVEIKYEVSLGIFVVYFHLLNLLQPKRVIIKFNELLKID